MNSHLLPLPTFFEPQKVDSVWRVSYRQRAEAARQWAIKQRRQTTFGDKTRICLLIIDAQNTFCQPEFELFVAGYSVSYRPSPRMEKGRDEANKT